LELTEEWIVGVSQAGRGAGKRRYRSELSITIEILEYVKNRGPVGKTSIIGAINLNSKNGNKYLQRLQNSGLIVRTQSGYVITAKGVLALNSLKAGALLLAGPNDLTLTCKRTIAALARKTGRPVRFDIPVYSPTGLSYYFTIYMPEDRVGVLVVDRGGVRAIEYFYSHIIAALASIDPEDLRRLVLVADEATAEMLRRAFAIVDERISERLAILSGCDEGAFRDILLAG